MIKPIVPTLLVMLTCPFQLSSAAEQLKAGAASTVITPPIGFPMWGYAARKDAPSVGVLDPLKARALVLEVGTGRLAIVSLDLGRAPTRAHTAAIRERVRAAGVTNILLVASHTHHGPTLELDTWPDPKDPYTAKLDQLIGDLILAAVKNLVPARWGIASHETQLNHNRHSKRPDAPVDRTLSVVRVETLDGKLIANAVNFAAHPTMTDAKDLRFSADYVGAFAAFMEKETEAPCLFLQGAAGDLSPQQPPGVRGPAEFGRALGKEVVELAKTIRFEDSKQPKLRVETEDFTFKPRLDVSNPIVKAALGQAFFPEFIAFYEREYRDGVRPQMTVAMLDGRLGIVGVSGEFFCGHALSLRRRARMDHLLICAYCNDYHQYFPTIEAATEGGYGTAPPVAMAELGAGERVTDRALMRLYRLRGLLID
jgi:neutral ceramidase